MSGSNRTGQFFAFTRNENAWADFFITRVGLILFAAILLLAAFRIYPVYQEREIRSDLDAAASDITSKIEAVDSVTIPEYRYNYVFGKNSKNIGMEISTEFVITHSNISSFMFGERGLTHAEPVMVHVYPPNSNWKNVSEFRKYVSDTIGDGKNGDGSSPLEFSEDKEKIDTIFGSIEKELALTPFIPDLKKAIYIEKVIINYRNNTQILRRDYVFIFQ
ncbi:MAG: hypothetical protein OIN87_06380 [Candidatus Methanoperedens sp.]|nr:hypothetical protein [Candidatus Methanoperedens sp.]